MKDMRTWCAYCVPLMGSKTQKATATNSKFWLRLPRNRKYWGCRGKVVVCMSNQYLGSKATSGLSQTLTAMMPSHLVCIETHLGCGVIMRRKPAALTSATNPAR